jgi:hypothetical protein
MNGFPLMSRYAAVSARGACAVALVAAVHRVGTSPRHEQLLHTLALAAVVSSEPLLTALSTALASIGQKNCVLHPCLLTRCDLVVLLCTLQPRQ